MRCVTACHNRWMLLRNAVGWDGWADQLKLIQDSETALEKDMKSFNTKAVKEYLRKSNTQLEELVEQAKKAAERALTTDHDKIVGSFNVVENENENKKPAKLVKSYIANTCEWFISHENYKEWLRWDGVDLLLVSAPPGCGKTVLAAYLLEQELPKQWPHGQICYYFFDNQGAQKTVTNAIRALIHQLLDKNAEIVGVIESDVNKADKHLEGNRGQLGAILKKAAESRFAGRVICVVDGLDECGRSELEWFVDWLKQYKSHEGIPSIKFLVTTQGLPDILKMFKSSSGAYRHISAEDESLSEMLQKEIEVVMKKRFDEFAKGVILESDAKGGSKKQASLWKSMGEASRGQRTYLWLKLVFDALYRSKQTQKDWEAVVKSPPLTIVGAYDKLFKFVEDEDKDQVKVLLSLVYASSATRPLTISEANMATTIHHKRLSEQASIASEDQLVEDEMEPDAVFRERVIRQCGFFVSISDNRLYFIHQSARDYLSLSQEKLEKARKLKSNNPDTTANNASHSFGGCLSNRSAHATITECCVAYLAMDKITAFDDYVSSRSILSSSPPSDLSGLRFLEYSMQNWTAHFRMAQEFRFEGDKPTVLDIDDRFSDSYFALWDNVAKKGKYTLLKPVIFQTTVENRGRIARSNPPSVIRWSNDILAVSVANGQAKLLKRLLESAEQKDLVKIFNKTFETWDDNFQTSNLCAVACSEGYIGLTRYILDHGMTLKLWTVHKTLLCHSLISFAVYQQLAEMVVMLLERGAEIDADEFGFGGAGLGIPLLLDIRMGLACSSVLLKHGATFEQAFNAVPREFSYKTRDYIKKLDMHGFATHEGFQKAVNSAGYNLEKIRADPRERVFD
jgi:hypothetical protein